MIVQLQCTEALQTLQCFILPVVIILCCINYDWIGLGNGGKKRNKPSAFFLWWFPSCSFCPPRARQEAKKAEVVSKCRQNFEQSVFNDIHTMYTLKNLVAPCMKEEVCSS